MEDVVAGAQGSKVRVRSPRANDLEAMLRCAGAAVVATEPGLLEVTGSSLEDAYLQLTANDVEYHSTPVGAAHPSGAQPVTEGASR